MYQYNDGRQEPNINHILETDGDIFSMNVIATYSLTSTKCRLYYAQFLGESELVTINNCEVIVLKVNDWGGYAELDVEDIGLANDVLSFFF